jgi:hypothetical protein
MQIMRTVLVAGVAAIALAGASGLALAQGSDSHVLTVQLPNGAVEQIRYTGDVPPQIILAPQAEQIGSPFAMLERLSAEMDRQAAVMFQAMDTLAAQPFPGNLTEAGMGGLPDGALSTSIVSTRSGSGVCSRSIEVTYTGHGQPKVVSQTSGDCGAQRMVPAELPAVRPPAHPAGTIEVKAEGPASPYQGLVHPVAAWRD